MLLFCGVVLKIKTKVCLNEGGRLFVPLQEYLAGTVCSCLVCCSLTGEARLLETQVADDRLHMHNNKVLHLSNHVQADLEQC